LSQYELPSQIHLTLEEAGRVLLALYDVRDVLGDPHGPSPSGDLLQRLNQAILVIQRKIVPDFPE
jgi:hypothetical protein